MFLIFQERPPERRVTSAFNKPRLSNLPTPRESFSVSERVISSPQDFDRVFDFPQELNPDECLSQQVPEQDLIINSRRKPKEAFEVAGDVTYHPQELATQSELSDQVQGHLNRGRKPQEIFEVVKDVKGQTEFSDCEEAVEKSQTCDVNQDQPKSFFSYEEIYEENPRAKGSFCQIFEGQAGSISSCEEVFEEAFEQHSAEEGISDDFAFFRKANFEATYGLCRNQESGVLGSVDADCGNRDAGGHLDGGEQCIDAFGEEYACS